ncbi:MAG TPA: lysylphosphatidylglycerol synthase domain-containing protein [Ornithinimicrobium sp.]|uniref:lysylphosphatidylglycerol synthase domain-containing protein n=1 Tax=Ornithinimicrobium sp. TaxID=1977084 RepID=UPI002B48141D|nr:lysylphosphatidylglycerol synthase domain-containing protein [Ornithinimicrobium sp.]HKJ12850.1 lysylphosphatidylglycerol synthase domain-containing protein [Ornithinimicrobium sp.]
MKEHPPEEAARFGWRETAQSVAGIALAAALVVFGLPWVAETTWPQIAAQLRLVGPGSALGMAALLLAGLYCYTHTMIASLPGLTHLRALMVNAAGSMVSNLLPGGGAVGVALTYVMFRSWGHLRRAISTSILVLTVWNILARLALPVLGALFVLLGPVQAPRPVLVAAALAAGIGVLVLGFFAGTVFSERVAREVGGALGTLASPLARRFPQLADLDHFVADQRARVEAIVRRSSLRLSLGLAGMFGFLFVLYVVASRSVGLELGLAALFAAYAFRQFLTVVAITPGGLGVTEVGTVGILVAFGGDPSAAAAAALLYAVFTHLLEVPLGAVALLAWWAGRRRRARTEVS